VSRGFSRVLPDVVVVVTALVLTWPMWTGEGYGLARDLVFTPRAPWTLDAIGMGSTLPRAVPLDAVLAALTSVVDGAVVFRMAVAGVLLAAGAGAHRLVAGLWPDGSAAVRCLVAVVAVWNPFVVERLALGQWALLATYAALWWLLPAVRRVVAGDRRAWPVVVCAGWLGSLTPTGGAAIVLVAGAGVVTALVLRRSPRRELLVLAVVMAAQLPWVLAGILGTTPAISDAAGVEAFAARAERSGGVWVTLLGTGGVWSPFQVPGSLASWPGHLLTAAVVVALVAGGPRLLRREPALALAAAIGFLLAGAAHLPGGEDLLGWLVARVPGGGLLRDGQKWLMPYVVFVVASAGAGAAKAQAALERRDVDVSRVVLGALVLLPVALMPDAAARTWEVVEPVRYPAELKESVSVLDGSEDTGDAVTLPWASYRRFSWGNPLSAADPLPRWTSHRVVVSDSLVTATGSLEGEDPRAAAVGAVVADPEGPIAARLAALHVGWVLVYREGEDTDGLDTTGLELVVDGDDVRLYRVPHVADDPAGGPARAAVVAVGAVDVVWGLVLLVALVAAVPAVRRRRSREVTQR
jgi:hypothetical protein